MTIFCSICRTIPPTYIVIDGKTLCLNCSDERYKEELRKLNNKYGKETSHAN